MSTGKVLNTKNAYFLKTTWSYKKSKMANPKWRIKGLKTTFYVKNDLECIGDPRYP